MKGYMAKKQKKIPVQKRTGTVALLSLFCAAAGVYAESDGWSYNDSEKSVIHAGESHARIAPVKKGEELEDQSKIGNIKKAEISDNASFRYDPALGKDELKGIVYDNESGVHESASLKMSEGASLDVDATKSRDGKTDWSGKSAVGVEFAKDTTATIEAKDASISVKGDTGATAISASDASTKLGNVEIGSVSAKATDSAKAFAINANDADSVKIGSVSGNIKLADAGTVDLGSMQGNIEAANVKDSISVAEKITGNITATSAKDVVIGEISGNVKIDTIGNSVNIGSLDGNLVSTNVGNSSSESSVANITVKSASNTAREVNIDNLAATATISGDEENAEAAKINVGTAEKKLSVNGKVEASVNEAKGGLSAELKNADANALYVKSVKGGAEIAGEGNVNIVNAEASATPAIKIGDLNGNFAAGFDSSAATSGAIKGDVEIGSISGDTDIINLDGNLTAGTLGADETSTTLIGVSGADKTVDITTANGTTTVNGNGSLEAKVGTSNGNLTVSDYKNATIGEVKDGSKLVLIGSDKDATANVAEADRVEANALGETTIGSANYVKAADSVDASLSIEGQNVKITDASGEYVVDTKALANEGTVEINKGSIANSIDGFNGNVKANETGTIKVEGDGMTGGLDIDKINGDLTSAENAKISGNVDVREVNKVDIKGGIAAIDGKENTGNLTIGTANDNVAVSGGVAGNMKVADAKKDVAVDTVGKNLTIGKLNGGTVKADEVTETVKVSAGTGTVEVTTAGNVDVATTDGKLTIDGQKVSADGSLSIKNTGVVEGGQVHVGAISGDSTVNGFKGDLTVDSNTGKIDVSTIDGKLTAKNAQGDINVATSATEIEATLNGGNINAENATVGSAKVDGQGKAIIGKASSIEANTSNGNLHLDGNMLQIEGGTLDVDVANVSKKEDGTVAEVKATGALDSVEIKNVNDSTNVSFNDVTKVNGGTGNVDITDSKLGTVSASGTVEGDFNVTNVEGKIASTGEIQGTTNITDFTGDASFNTVKDVNVNSADPDNKKGLIGSLTIAQGQGAVTFNADAGTVDIKLDGGSVTTGLKPNGDAVVLDSAKFSGNGTVNVTVDKLESFDQIKDSVVIEKNKLSSGGDLNSQITVNSGEFTITNADSITVDSHNENGGRKLTIEKEITDDVTIARIGKDGVAVAAENAIIGGNLDIDTAAGSVTVGTVNGRTEIDTANGDVTVIKGENVTIADANGNVNLGTAKNVKIDTVANNVDIDNVGRVEIASVGGQTTIGTAKDDVSIKTANDLVKVDNGTNVSVVNGKDVTVGSITGALKVDQGNAIKVDTKAGSLDLGTVTSVDAGEIANNVDIDSVGTVNITKVGGKTTIGDIAADKVATVGTAGDIDINGKGSLTVENEAGNITAGNIKQVSVTTANGNINIVTAEDLTFTTVKGNVNVSSEIKTVNGGNVNGYVSIAKNTGNVKLGTVNNLVLSNVAGGDSFVDTVNNKAEITTTTGNATIKESKQLQGTVDGGTLTANTVSDIANITVNSGTANVGSAKSLDATVNGGSLNVDNVASSSNAAVKGNGGKSIFKTIAGKLKALLNGGEVEVVKNTGNVEISGSGDATVKDSTGSLEVATSTADKFVKNTNGGISTKGNLNVAIDKATSANFGTVNGGDIVDMTKIDNLTVSESTGILNVGLEGGQVKGNIVIEKATADVNVGNVANLDVTLRNNANLLAIDNTKVDAATVNGGCDASYYNVGTLTVDRSLDGNLEVRGAVSNSADINNVSGTVAINEVASTATASIKNAGSAIVDKAYGKVEFSDFASGSATVNNATANIEATNVAGGLNIGNVADVKVNNTNVNVLDGNTVNGKIESASGMTLSNSGTATIGNSGQIVVNGDLNVASEFKFAQTTIDGAVIKANNLSGSGATKTVDNFFDAKFGFSGDDSVMEAAALKGTHNAGSSYIDANIDDMSVSHTYVDVTYKNTDGSKVGYEITKNSYLSDKFAKSDNEKALAEIYDNLVFQDDATKDGESVQKKKNFKALAENGNIGAMLPQAVNHAARMNMDLSNMIHLDTINRTAYTRDMLNRINYLKAKGKLRGRHTDVLSGASSVTVRNINRFASYSGDGNIAGSNDSVYGGLANVEYVFDDSLFAGIGIGGFQAKSNGKDASGKAETQSFALNAYADYLFYDNFDWYFGLTYAYGMNEAERNSGFSMNKGKWDSNLVGAFTGVRYAWKPIADREFYIKPLLGMNVSFLMNPSFTENGDSERLDVDSEDYTSVKGIAGIEASYLLDCGLSVAGRMFYTHEFADNRYDITSSFIGSGYSVNTFKTLGSEIKRDSGIFGIGLGYDINPDWRVYLDYAAEVADDVYHNLNAGVQLKF